MKPGTYRERVIVKGPSKRYLKIIGDPKNPGRVILSGKKSTPRTLPNNGISVNGADNVTINGLSAYDYNGYGFFAVNVNDYLYTNLIAKRDGVYGVYAFNSVGGTISNSTAAWNNDSGFYIGQTPVQTKPKRSYITNVVSYGNQLGYSGTNMRYVTITKSKWFNNGIGLVPNALDSEKFAPPEKNVISDNDIFWNNYNYYAGSPWKIAGTSTGTNFPVGIGVLLFGGRENRVENNRIWGNYTAGVGGLQQALLKQVDAQELVGQHRPRQRLLQRRQEPERARPVLRRRREEQLLRPDRHDEQRADRQPHAGRVRRERLHRPELLQRRRLRGRQVRPERAADRQPGVRDRRQLVAGHRQGQARDGRGDVDQARPGADPRLHDDGALDARDRCELI